ncbi:hypothetical protein NCCP691_37850 [Noviherbaspirillum aridicola]|uniref:Uncharacterized protein n=1 Tax=Noviherbaspirillum aridicola TaxID=2849687 RepID=A0ABQ4Q9P3_9BURK|nr:hypothetical protein NCCP691_37850 [Noviherbaspirillum aridicola]
MCATRAAPAAGSAMRGIHAWRKSHRACLSPMLRQGLGICLASAVPDLKGMPGGCVGLNKAFMNSAVIDKAFFSIRMQGTGSLRSASSFAGGRSRRRLPDARHPTI